MSRLNKAARTDQHSGLCISPVGMFLTEVSVSLAKKMRDQHIVRRVETEYAEVTPRVFVPCKFLDEPMLADVVTGSLYELYSGKCLSGKLWLVDAPGREVHRKRYDGIDLASTWKRRNGKKPKTSLQQEHHP